MKIQKVTLRNYRRHEQLEVSFAADRTLIHGPNEIGKSSLIEAIHRCLFYRHKSRAAGLLERMQPRTGGDPEVTIEFATGGVQYTLQKKFRGPTGSRAVLKIADDQRLEGDAAEDALLKLLQVDEVRGQQEEAFNAQWAHLWVWQGSAQDEPADKTSGGTVQQLRHQLQQQEGLGVLASHHDDAVKAVFLKRAEAIFGQGTKPKKKSRLGQAEEQLAAAVEKTKAATEQFQASLEATDRLVRAEELIATSTKTQSEAAAAIVPIQQQLAEAKRLAGEQSDQQKLVDRATEQLEALQQSDTAIRQLAGELTDLARRIEPAEAQLAQLKKQQAERATKTETAAAALEASRQEISRVQDRRDLFREQQALIQAGQQAGELAELISRISSAETAIDSFIRAVDNLPPIDNDAIQELAKLEEQLRLAQAKVELTATGIELQAVEHELWLNGRPLALHDRQTITEAATITIDGQTELVITPGGGASLAAAREDAAAAEQQLRERLAALGVTDLEAAADRLAQRQQLTLQIDQHELAISTLLGVETREELAERERTSRQRVAEAEQRVAALRHREDSGLATVVLPERPAELEQAAAAVEAEYEQLQQTVRARLEAAEAARQSQTSAEQDVLQAEQAVFTDRTTLETLRRRHETLEGHHGDEATRAQALLAARAEQQAAQAAVAATAAQLDQLDCPGLEADRSRFERVAGQAAQTIQDARESRAAAQAVLTQAGSIDLHEARASAQAAQAAAQRECEAARREAAAIARLRDCFTAISRERADQVVAPLRAKAEDYLTAMFGKGTKVALSFDDQQGFFDLQVMRPDAGGHSFSFTELSGGTREQVAAGLRLAMAEILAARYGGSLPVVFDDAFTNSDPERIGRLQRMLDLAASRGLQVIVLSCGPAAYRMFGATEIDLVNLLGGVPPGTSPAASELQPGP
jgi:DNA repair exonuclease SbcCD ATPase subunit